MVTIQPYVSIDIETTGIDSKSQILQIAAVYDDGVGHIDRLLFIDLPIKHKTIEYAEPYALGMNADLLKNMNNKEFKSYSPSEAANALIEFLRIVKIQCDKKVMLAGKNVAVFDIPKIRTFLESDTSKDNFYHLPEFNDTIDYRSLDIGSLYFDIFGRNASLSDINKLTGRNAVSHNALDDAYDVVYAVRHKIGAINA